MSEIEKMYENVGLESHFCEYPRFCDDNNCNECPYYASEFTAEKQLELIKWLASKQYAKYTTSLLINIRDTVRFSGGLIAGVCTLNVRYDKQDKDFENALAGLINEMWQDLTEEEQEQMRRILNE